MTDLSAELILILAIVAMIAGFVDSIAGGGGLIAIPALMFSGLTPVEALGTNKLQAIFGKLSSVRYFYKQKIIDISKFKTSLILCFLFAGGGACLIQTIDLEALNKFIPWLITAAAVYILFSPRFGDTEKTKRITIAAFGVFIVPLISFYDGFLGPSSGSFFAISFILLLGFSASKATAYAKLFY